MKLAGLGVCVCLCLAAGCARGGEATAADALDRHSPQRLYPLAEGTVWTYDVDTGEALPTLAITRVEHVEGSRVQVSSGGPPLTYEVRPEGLYRVDRGGWLLKAPVRPEATWDAGRGATAVVVEGGHGVVTEAGSFRDCLTVEESGGPSGMRVRTTYCPDVGPVEVESSLADAPAGAQATVSARLRGFALRGL